MEQQFVGQQAFDLSSVLDAGAEKQAKILEAVKAAREVKAKTLETNVLKKKAKGTLIAQINETTSKKLEDERKAMEKAYKDKLVSLGLTAEAYPMETAFKAVDDKGFKPALAGVGIAAAHVTNVAVGFWDRVKTGFQAARK